MLILLVFCLFFNLCSIKTKIISKCDLATAFKENLNEENWKNLGDWMCLAISGKQTTEPLDTSFVLIPAYSQNTGIKGYGIFQINNVQLCEEENSKSFIFSQNYCQQNCTDFINDDISDDVKCAQTAYDSLANGNFKIWTNWLTDCKGNDLDQYRYLDNCSVTPQPAIPKLEPRITNVTLLERAHDQVISCNASGVPRPKLHWEYDQNVHPDLITSAFVDDHSVHLNLIFPLVHSFYFGIYACVARNFYGEDKQWFSVNVQKVKEPDISSTVNNGGGVSIGLVVGIPLVIVIIAGVVIIFVIKRFVLKPKNGLTKAEIEEFQNGSPEYLNSDEILPENIQNLPYDSKLNIPQSELNYETTNKLGEGQYGYVTKGEFKGSTVAIKTVKPNTDKIYIKALLSELKIMAYIGKHKNVVSLIGAVTEKLDKGALLIVVEFCERGDLLNYLRKHRNKATELVLLFGVEDCTTADGNDGIKNLKKTTTEASHYLNIESEAEEVENADDEYENMDQLKNLQNEASLTIETLITWCHQIAEGMDYLASRKIIHADLAARNVLLTSNKEAKITDFGLSRRLYDYTNYVKKEQAPLPWRHMAIESLKEMSFSVESDIWAFGITMWEIFSLGEVPYAGRSWSLDFVNELESGLRLLKPKYAPEFVYELMISCWNPDKFRRPEFARLAENLGEHAS